MGLTKNQNLVQAPCVLKYTKCTMLYGGNTHGVSTILAKENYKILQNSFQLFSDMQSCVYILYDQYRCDHTMHYALCQCEHTYVCFIY